MKGRHVRVSGERKAEILKLVSDSGLPRWKALTQLKLPRSTYCRWLQRLAEGRFHDREGGNHVPWNKIRPEEEARILAEAWASPELSWRQVAFEISDLRHTYVSESTVYRILKREGLIKPVEIIGFKAAKEYRRKTKRPNERCSNSLFLDSVN